MIREIDESILTEEEIKEFQKDRDSFVKKREKELKNFIGEEWKPINDYGGLYWISNYGRVKSIEKVIRNRTYPAKIMSYTHHKKYKQNYFNKLFHMCLLFYFNYIFIISNI